MLRICTWKWDNGIHPKKRMKFSAKHVNILGNMLKRNLKMDYEFCCITDDPTGIDKDTRIIELWKEHLDLGGCFVRLKMFSDEMEEVIGERFASIDLDTVIVGDVTPIFEREEDFIIWGEHWRKNPYCGSLWMMDAGCRTEVYEGFKPPEYQKNQMGKWPNGTDQARINDCLYPDEVMWGITDGIFNFRDDIRVLCKTKQQEHGREQARKMRAEIIERAVEQAASDARKVAEEKGRSPRAIDVIVRKAMIRARHRALELAVKEAVKERKIYKDMEDKVDKGWGGNTEGKIPDNARIIFFNGCDDPSDPELQDQYPWIKEYWK